LQLAKPRKPLPEILRAKTNGMFKPTTGVKEMSNQETNAALTNSSNSNSSFDHSMITSIQAGEALNKLNRFIGTQQRSAINVLCQGEERQFFYEVILKLANLIELMPTSYQTDGQGDQATVYLHYFTPSADFYITEKDYESDQLQAFGKADLFGDGGEVGYISIVEILKASAELDLHWTPKKLGCI
jgi:hypothetical protein